MVTPLAPRNGDPDIPYSLLKHCEVLAAVALIAGLWKVTITGDRVGVAPYNTDGLLLRKKGLHRRTII